MRLFGNLKQYMLTFIIKQTITVTNMLLEG